MGQTTFRQASSQAEESSSQPVERKSTEEIAAPKHSTDPSPIFYRQENKRPYVAKHLNIENVYPSMPDTVHDHAEAIDEYFESQVKSGKYENDAAAYKVFFRDLEKKTDTRYSPMNVKLAAMDDFINYLIKRKTYGN